MNSSAPLELVIGVFTNLIGEQFPEAFSCIHFVVPPNSLQLAAGHRLPPELADELAGISIGAEGTLPGRAAHARAMLYELDTAIRSLRARHGECGEAVRLTGLYHNLVRRWADA